MKLEILSNVISSQIKIHRKWGGVYPTLAKREHQKNLIPVLRKVLKESNSLKLDVRRLTGRKRQKEMQIRKLEKILERELQLSKNLVKFFSKYKKPEIDLLAVTIGPGLEPCLWVGVNFAKALAFSWNLPIVPINHIEAHIYANFITRPGLVVNFPAVCLVVSGGHTQLILMKDYGEYKILGETRDDAAGECFDKVARILGMGYPGGPAIEAEASKLQATSYLPASRLRSRRWQAGKLQAKLPRPMIYHKNYDFSFSGLKTAVLYHYQNQLPKIRTSKKYIQEMSAEVQQAIIDVLIHKTIKAAKEYKAKSIILGGGVVANRELRKQFQSAINNQQLAIKFLVPPKIFCTDNAAMVAVAGYSRWLKGEDKNWTEIKAKANIKIC